MKQTNKRVSITTRAKRSSGNVRCDKCKFCSICSNDVKSVQLCNYIYVRAYTKGYKQSTKDHKNDHIINW